MMMMNQIQMKHLIQVSCTCLFVCIFYTFIETCLGSQQSDTDTENDDEEEYQAYLMEDESDDEGLKQEGSSKKQHQKPVYVFDKWVKFVP